MNRSHESEDFSEIAKLLESVEIKIPAKINKDKEGTSNLFRIFVGNKDTIINGVTDAASGTDLESFFFFNICPKLQVHGFTEIEKVAGVRWRRYNITKKGTAFLADFERRKFKLSQESSKTETPKPPAVKTASRSKPVKAANTNSASVASQGLESSPES